MDLELKDHVAVVTGGGSGIGGAICDLLAREGVRVLIADWDEKNGQEMAAAINKSGGVAQAVTCDVSQRTQIEAAVDQAVSTWGRLDIMINNAGIARDGGTMKIDEKMWNDVLAVNLSGVFWGSQAALRHMRARGYGRIINTASIAINGAYGQGNYAASKAGVVALTRTQALEFCKHGITVNAVAPGVINTPLLQTARPEVREQVVSRIPRGRVGQPEDIARMFLFLAAPRSDFITGQCMVVDGGATLSLYSLK